MKKVLLSIAMLCSVTLLVAQGIPRDMVALEIGTGTWCTYCPGAAMGADDLLENGCKVSVIENHNGDSYANTYSNARNTYYAITGYPTAVFDGLIKVVGGSHSQSMYGTYLPKYNQRIAIPANISLEMDVTNNGLDYTAVITIVKVGTVTATDLKLHLFVTQSHIQQNWQGQTHLEHVNRLMVPNQNGTAISFASGDTQVITLNWTMNAAWPIEDCEFIPLVQSQSSKETFNCIKRGAIDLSVDFTPSETQINRTETVTFTNNTSGGYIGTPETYQWTFPGGEPSSSTEKNPTVTYNEIGDFDVILIVDRGSQVKSETKIGLIHVDAGVGVKNNGKAVRLSVYPNPNHGSFTVEISSQKNAIYDLTVVNAAGATVYTENNVSVNGKITRNLDLELGSGTYFVVLKNGNQKTTKKFMVN